jgi:hypothetical protein
MRFMGPALESCWATGFRTAGDKPRFIRHYEFDARGFQKVGRLSKVV